MTQHSIIEHRANYHFLKIEEDYIAICPGKHSHCKAAILSLLEHWMNSKRTDTSSDDDLFIYMSYPQFVKHLFNLYGRSIVIISLDELEQEELIIKRPYIDAFNQDTFEYRLNRTAVQAKLNALPELPSRSLMGSLKVNGGSSKVNDPSLKVNDGSFENKRVGSSNVNGGSFKSKRNIDTTKIPNRDTTEISIERESTASESHTPTVSPPVVGALALPSKTEAFVEKLREWRIEDERQGDAHAHIPPGSADRAGTLPSADMGDLPASGQDRSVATPTTRPVVPTGQEKIGDNHAVVATHTPGGGDTARSVDHRPEQAVREAVHGEAVSKKGRDDGQLEQNTPTPAPAQANPPTSEQAALGQAPKWNVAAMVAEAERLREKPFSAIARPKETKKAQALFKRKPDLTREEFEDAWKNWDTDWWRKTNGPFTLTDLAATPKDKSEMRLILALEKLALARANPRQSNQLLNIPRVRVFSSYDDPNFRSDQDFYPVEGGSYATAVV